MTAALPYNPYVLRWARERSGLQIDEAAKKVNTTAEKLADWESPSGERRPTIKQARRLASVYGRPFLEFFAKKVPELTEHASVPDFRFHRVGPSIQERVGLSGIQEWAEELRFNALDLAEMLGEEVSPLPDGIYANVFDDVDRVAERVRNITGPTVEEQISLKSSERRLLPEMIRKSFSDCGVLIAKNSDISKFRTRGLCIFNEKLPIIVFGNEAPGAQSFTICHEFAHIVLQTSAISGAPRFGETKNYSKKIEGWCNKFAASFLMPEKLVYSFITRPESPQENIDDGIVEALSIKFSVSRHAMLIRLVDLDFVKSTYYWKVKRKEYIRQEENYKPPIMRSKYYGSRYKNSRGAFYTSLVLDAWQSGYISAHNAAEYMGIKNLRHLDDIRKNFLE